MRKPLIAAVAAATLLLSGCSGAALPSQPPVVDPSDPSTNPTVPGSPDPAPQPEPEPTPEPEPEPPKPVRREIPEAVRGLMVSGWYAGSPDLVWPLLTWAKGAGLNTVILDLKAEDGRLSWESNIPLAKEIGANVRKVGSLEETIAAMQEMGFWVAGRIVVMNDAYLYAARPEWGIPGFSGGAYSFMDPKNENVWAYNMEIALEAVAAGIDEIQFDYIRYPEKLVSGYNRDTDAAYRTSHIEGFLKAAVDQLRPLGVIVSADVFGLTTSVAEGDDMDIGQDYLGVAQIVDYISAMVYPSHYAAYTYGIPNPDADPYGTVKNSMQRAIERSEGIPLANHRPWIQDFTYPAAGAIPYGPAEVMAQVRALDELGIKSFLLWDARNNYTRDVDYNVPPR